MTDDALSCATTASIPMPRFHVPSVDSRESPARSASTRNTAGGDHEPRSTSTQLPTGSTRARFAAMPPPVTWLSACTAPGSSASTSSSGAV